MNYKTYVAKHIKTYVAKHVVYFADISKVQDDEVGDGTTSVVVLACELLRVGLNTNIYRIGIKPC